MNLSNCTCKCPCTIVALIISAIIGVITSFLQITGVIVVPTVFLWVTFGIAIVYLGVLVIATALTRRLDGGRCFCTDLNILLIGILGTVLFAVILLATGIAGASLISAILVGLLLFFFTLLLTGTACLVLELTDCNT